MEIVVEDDGGEDKRPKVPQGMLFQYRKLVEEQDWRGGSDMFMFGEGGG